MFRNAVGNYGFKLCDFENACKIGEVMTLGKYTKAWVSPEVYFASEDRREMRASAAVDVFSLGLILGALFDGNCYIDKTILPTDNILLFHRALSDQDYLYSLLPCNDSQFDKSWIHTMCSLDPSRRCTVSMIIRNFEQDTRTNLAMQNQYLKDNIESKLDTIDSKLTVILEKVTEGFDSLKSNLKDLIQSSFENVWNNSNDENNIFNKILIATEDFSERLKDSSNSDSNVNNLSGTKEGLKRMEDAMREAIASSMSMYEAERKQDMTALQTTILNRCQDLESILKDHTADSKDVQTTITSIARNTESLHQELVEVRQELVSMKQSLLQLAENTRSIVAGNEKLRVAMENMEKGLHRVSENNVKEYQKLTKKLQGIQTYDRR